MKKKKRIITIEFDLFRKLKEFKEAINDSVELRTLYLEEIDTDRKDFIDLLTLDYNVETETLKVSHKDMKDFSNVITAIIEQLSMIAMIEIRDLIYTAEYIPLLVKIEEHLQSLLEE